MPWNLESLSWAQTRIFVANYQQNRWVFLVKYCVQHQKGHYQGHDEQCCGQLRCQNALNHLHNHHHSWDRLEWVLRAEKESVIFIALSFWIQNGAEFVAGKAVTWAIEKGCPCTVEKNWDAHFRTVSVPKRTTSSDRISYIIPVRGMQALPLPLRVSVLIVGQLEESDRVMMIIPSSIRNQKPRQASPGKVHWLSPYIIDKTFVVKKFASCHPPPMATCLLYLL